MTASISFLVIAWPAQHASACTLTDAVAERQFSKSRLLVQTPTVTDSSQWARCCVRKALFALVETTSIITMNAMTDRP